MSDPSEQLKRQLNFIRTSAERYDEGDTDEGIRIGTSLRVLFHQTINSHSLLNQLRATNIHLLSTNEVRDPSAGFWPKLTNIELNPSAEVARFVPKLDTATRRFVSVSDWWAKEDVFYIAPTIITRKMLALGAANKDGGAHVDPALGHDYEMISRMGAGWKITLNPDNGPSKELFFQLAHVAALRQMAYEVLNSPELIQLAD